VATTTPSETLTVLDPRTGEAIGEVPVASAADVDAAVARAKAAQPAWGRTDAAARGAALKAAARAMREHLDELTELTARETGKPADDARGGIEAGIGTLEQYGELGPLHRGRTLQGSHDALDVMVFEPRGVAAVLTPWNDPIAIACGLLGANLAVGNAVVFKPSEKTPLASARMLELWGGEVPVEVVHGDGRTGRPLVAHAGVDIVCHVGSVATGREIARVTAERGAKALLELGGKDPVIVDAGVDPRWAAQQVAVGAFANAGQICVAAERVFVHRDVADDFLAALVEEAQATDIGPLIDARQREKVHAHVQEAVEQGARVLAGGELPDGPGFAYPPTVLVGVTPDMSVMTDETFGPVAPVMVVPDFETALHHAELTEYGLAAVVLTPSQANAQKAARELRAGTVKVNAMFGGAPGGAAHPHKASGSGFGYGPELLDEVAQVKVVHYAPAP
jgi:acyl-CoA reductase-like NAD-dependent aldehyde dehydrogenase